MSKLVLARLKEQGFRKVGENTFKKGNKMIEIFGRKQVILSVKNAIVKRINYGRLKRNLKHETLSF